MMTDREAMLALAAPEPEPFRQVRPNEEDRERWQAWNDRRLLALSHARAGGEDADRVRALARKLSWW